MKGPEFRKIRKELGLTRGEFAIELGYRGNDRNNGLLLRKYEHDVRQIPLTVASLAWLIRQWFEICGELPEWPEWEGYELKQLDDDYDGNASPAPNERDIP